jgi:anti-sigma-K factor RskA
LGAVSVDRAHRVVVPATLRADLTAKAVLAVTLEPAAGIPHAAPTGPIIAKGAIQL